MKVAMLKRRIEGGRLTEVSSTAGRGRSAASWRVRAAWGAALAMAILGCEGRRSPSSATRCGAPCRTIPGPTPRAWSSTTARSSRAPGSTASPSCGRSTSPPARCGAATSSRTSTSARASRWSATGSSSSPWKAGLAFVYDVDTFAPTDTLEYEGEGWGLCYDGESLFLSDGSGTLQRRDPATFAVLGELRVTRDGFSTRNLNELECVGDDIYANIYMENRIVRIDKATGEVTGKWTPWDSPWPAAAPPIPARSSTESRTTPLPAPSM